MFLVLKRTDCDECVYVNLDRVSTITKNRVGPGTVIEFPGGREDYIVVDCDAAALAVRIQKHSDDRSFIDCRDLAEKSGEEE